MQRKRFELIDLPPLRPEYHDRIGKSDNYYHRLMPWLEDMVNPDKRTFMQVDCHMIFSLDKMRRLGQGLGLP
jgi:hypothetical protein